MKLLEKKVFIGNNLNVLRRYIATLNMQGEAVLNYELLTPTLLINKLIDEYNNINNTSIRLISKKESAFIIYDLIKQNSYGLDKLSLSVDSVSKLIDLINDCRSNEVDSFNGIYKADYSLLVKDYEKYLDMHDLVDYIYALKKLFNEKNNIDAYILNDLDLSSLEKKAFNKLFKDVNYIEPLIAKNKIVAVVDTYGVYNELLNVVDIINTNKLALNDCEVVYTNDIYENLARGLFDSLGIKYRLSNVHARSTNLVSFILDIIDYINSDYKYELLEKVLKNQSIEQIYLDEFYKTLYFPTVIVGFGKDRTKLLLEDIKDDETKINIYNFLNDLLEATSDDFNYELFINFIKKYSMASSEKIALIDRISNLKYLLNYTDDKLKVLADEVSSIRYSEADSSDSLIIASINKSFSIRPNLFILGLSQTYLNCHDSENPFIMDVNIYSKQFESGAKIHTLECLKSNITDCLDYYIKYSNSDIYLSYTSFNKIDMRDSAKSIYLINLAKDIASIHKNLYEISVSDIHMKNKELVSGEKQVPSFDNGAISSEDDHLDLEEEKVARKLVKKNTEFKLSPSAITNLINCPLQYYYQYIAKLQDVSYQNLDVANWLEANEKGTLFHRVLELYATNAMMEANYQEIINEAIFKESFEKALGEAVLRNASRNEYIKYKEMKDIKDAAHSFIIKTLEKDFKNKLYRVLACEFDLCDKYKAVYPDNDKLILNGYIDRLDGYLDGKVLHLRFVDYKSGAYKDKETSHYIQHILYPYAISLYKEKLFNLDYDVIVVDSFIYSYPFSDNENVYDAFEIREGEKYDTVFKMINEVIIPYLENEEDLFNKIYDIVNNKVDNLTSKEGKEMCKFCHYKDVCVKRVKDGYDEE